MASSPHVNVLFVGAGAVGCFYASRLHHPQYGLHVSLIARSNYSQIFKSGVHLKTHTFGDYDFHPAAVYPSVNLAAASGVAWDFIIVTTKALPGRTDGASLITPLVNSTSVILVLQNGIDIEELYSKRHLSNPILSGITYVTAEKTSPGTIRQHRYTKLCIGPYTDRRKPHDRTTTKAAAQLVKWFTAHGGVPDAEAHDATTLQILRWHKLAINAALNPTSILAGGRSTAEMAVDPVLRRHLESVMREIWDAVPAILKLDGLHLAIYRDKTRFPDWTVVMRSVERSGTGSKPSMLQDWEAGRPLEVEAILGNAVRIAREQKVELVRTRVLYALMRSAQNMRDGETKRKGRAGGKL